MTKTEAMKKGGAINREVMQALFRAARPGVRLSDLDKLAGEMFLERGASPSFKGYRGYPGNICANVGNGLIHGIPNDYQLREGDLLTIDQGVFYQGYHTDHAESVKIQSSKLKVQKNIKYQNPKVEEFLKIGEKALDNAISQAVVGHRVGDISSVIEETIEKAGFVVVKDYVGHGVGERLHEDPEIPCFGKAHTGPKLEDGQTLAIEVMYLDKPSRLEIAADGWTVVAKDATLAGLFEKTVVVGRREAVVLT